MAREIKDENIQIGRLLQQARENKKVLQSEMVEPCDLTKNHISAVERGVSQASISCSVIIPTTNILFLQEYLHSFGNNLILQLHIYILY